jgi:hypothetical protein
MTCTRRNVRTAANRSVAGCFTKRTPAPLPIQPTERNRILAYGMTVDSSLVDRIVNGVLQQMQRPEAVPVKAVASAQSPPPARDSIQHKLSQAVITAGLIEELVPRTATQIVVSPKAVVTPSALDVVRARKLTIRREAVARTETSASARTLAIVVRNTPVLERLHKQQAGLWRRELLGCPDDAAALAISALCRGDADRVLVFAAQHHRAACLANRHGEIRAVAISSADDLRTAAEQIRVNVVCIDPANRGDFEMTRLLDQFKKPGGLG